MKVILQQDVANIGTKLSVVDVPNGYALNKLIPSGKAVAATEQNLKRVEAHAAKQHASADEQAAKFTAAVAALTKTPATVTAKANEKGQLFQAVTPEQVVAAAATAGAEITPDMVKMPEPIKTVDTHEIELVSGGESATVSLSVAAE